MSWRGRRAISRRGRHAVPRRHHRLVPRLEKPVMLPPSPGSLGVKPPRPEARPFRSVDEALVPGIAAFANHVRAGSLQPVETTRLKHAHHVHRRYVPGAWCSLLWELVLLLRTGFTSRRRRGARVAHDDGRFPVEACLREDRLLVPITHLLVPMLVIVQPAHARVVVVVVPEPVGRARVALVVSFGHHGGARARRIARAALQRHLATR